MKITIYTATIIYSECEEYNEHDVRIFNSFEEAKKHIDEVENKWFLMHAEGQNKKLEEVKDWLEEGLYDNPDGSHYWCKHYIYGEGREKVFAIDEHEIDVEEKIYMSKVLVDMSKSYCGIDDTLVSAFYTREEAVAELKKLYDLYKDELSDEDGELNDDQYDEECFHINNDRDYITGELVEFTL